MFTSIQKDCLGIIFAQSSLRFLLVVPDTKLWLIVAYLSADFTQRTAKTQSTEVGSIEMISRYTIDVSLQDFGPDDQLIACQLIEKSDSSQN